MPCCWPNLQLACWLKPANKGLWNVSYHPSQQLISSSLTRIQDWSCRKWRSLTKKKNKKRSSLCNRRNLSLKVSPRILWLLKQKIWFEKISVSQTLKKKNKGSHDVKKKESRTANFLFPSLSVCFFPGKKRHERDASINAVPPFFTALPCPPTQGHRPGFTTQVYLELPQTQAREIRLKLKV